VGTHLVVISVVALCQALLWWWCICGRNTASLLQAVNTASVCVWHRPNTPGRISWSL